MTNIFSQILNMSLTASVVILFVMAARLLLKRAPKVYAYALWAVVLFRLLCPVSLPSSVSLLELTSPQVTESTGITSTVSYLPVEYVYSDAPEDGMPELEAPAQAALETEHTQSEMDAMTVPFIIWLLGIAIMTLYSAVVYVRLRWKLVGAMVYRGNVYLADHIGSPFVMGIFRPRIYMPSTVPIRERRYIIAHERHHIRRGDHIIKLLAYIALCIHWFNPLVWAAFILAGKDMEMSCDEAVIKKLGSHIRADYSASLLRLATHRTLIAGTPLAFGEGDTKGRVLNMAKWKKPKTWVKILCVILCILVLVACGMNPEEETEKAEPISGPASIGIGDLYFTLPEGLAMVRTEEQTSSTSLYNNIFTDGGDTVGGVYVMDKPELELLPQHENMWQWVEALEVPENVPEDVFLMEVSWTEGDMVTAFYGGDGVVQRSHSFFFGTDVVYDIWFDEQAIGEETKQSLLESAIEETLTAAAESRRFLFGDLYITLPEDCTYREEQNVMQLYQGETLIGGMMAYKVPDDVDWANTSGWLHSLLEDGNDPNLGYMGGGSLYGDYEVNFFTDVPPGTEIEKVDRLHTFFYTGGLETVYDVWFDTLVTTNTTRNAILGSITGAWEPLSVEERDRETVTVPENAVSFTDLYSGYDGTAEFVILTGPLDREALEAENGVSLEELMEKAKEEFLTTSVSSFGFNPEAMGHEGENTTVEIYITDLKKGEDYLITADRAVPTIELWGKRYYHFENGDTMGIEEKPFPIMTMNALDGTVLARLGKKG